MNVVFSNPCRPEYGVATIPFPIPKTDYDSSIFHLAALEIGDARHCDCKVEEISEDSPIFQRLVGSCINVDELDYLVKRMDSFDQRELAQFYAVAISQNIHEIKDLINLTFCCQDIPIVQDFTDLEKVGQHCYMDKNGGAMTMENVQTIDFKKEALKLLLNETGKVTQYGVIYDQGFVLEQLYGGQRFPQYRYEDCVLEAAPKDITIPEALELSAQIQNFSVIREAATPTEYAKHQLSKYCIELQDELFACANLERYGQKLIAEKGIVLTDYGVLWSMDGQTVEQCLSREIPAMSMEMR